MTNLCLANLEPLSLKFDKLAGPLHKKKLLGTKIKLFFIRGPFHVKTNNSQILPSKPEKPPFL